MSWREEVAKGCEVTWSTRGPLCGRLMDLDNECRGCKWRSWHQVCQVAVQRMAAKLDEYEQKGERR